MDIKSLQAAQEYSQERFTKRILFKSDDSTAFVLNFEPGQELPTHGHPGTAVFLLVTSGEGTVYANGEPRQIVANDVVYVGGEEQFAFKNTGAAPASLFVVLAKLPDERYAKEL